MKPSGHPFARKRQVARSPLPSDSGLNIAYEAVDRHAQGASPNHVALRCLRTSGQVQGATYTGLMELTNRFANVLKDLGVGKGDRVFSLAGRIPELYITALGTLKTSVCTPHCFLPSAQNRFGYASPSAKPVSW